MSLRTSSSGSVEQAYRRLTTQAARPGAIVLCTITTDLDSGRGDVYVAAALGRALSAQGRDVMLLPKRDWRDVPADAGAVIALLPDFDPVAVPDHVPLIAWIRNETQRWAESPTLDCYDGLLSSSRLSLDVLRERYRGPTGWLPLAADPELFVDLGRRRRDIVSTVNGWGKQRDLHIALGGLEPRLRRRIALYGQTKGVPAALQQMARGPVSYFRLPDIYSRALLVLDDMNHTTLPYGNLNSRLFEALAAGALPVVNGRLGLADVGLEDVPTYRSPAELDAIIAEALGQPERMAEQARALRTTVLRDHTFAQRATTLRSFIDDVVASKDPGRLTLSFAPDYSRWNPFQNMLYTSVRDSGSRIVARDLPGIEQLAVRDTGDRLDGQVFHLHWTAPLLQSARDPFDAIDRLNRFKVAAADFQRRGGTLVWTIHNVLPHEVTHRVAEIELCRFLAANADAIHVLSEQTAEATRRFYELPADRVRLIEHSSYVGIYPDVIERDEARRRLHVQPSETALLFFGGIRPYKGVDDVLDVFDEALRREPGLRLLIAGLPGRFRGVQALVQRFEDHPRVTASFEFVPDDELQVWQRAADVAVLPYPSVLNSGAFQLALSFGLPVIAPRTGSLVPLLDPDYTLGYRAGDRNQLVEALAAAPDLARRAAGKSRAAAESRPPAQMADAFQRLLLEITGDTDVSRLSAVQQPQRV